jgi:proteasome lid subunit RPN8/RPN11
MIIIEPQAKQLMTADAVKTFPDECCGFLFGIEKSDDRLISDILIVNNAKEGDKKRRFEISPKDYMKAEQYAEKNNLQLLGVYHSHPNHPAVPSEHDRAAAQPWFSYIIISVINKNVDTIRSWRLNENNQFEEEKLPDYQFIQT